MEKGNLHSLDGKFYYIPVIDNYFDNLSGGNSNLASGNHIIISMTVLSYFCNLGYDIGTPGSLLSDVIIQILITHLKLKF